MTPDGLIVDSEREEQRARFDLSTHRRAFVTPGQLAHYLDVDPRTIVRMIHQQSLPGVRVGRSWRISTSAARAAFHVEPKQAKQAS